MALLLQFGKAGLEIELSSMSANPLQVGENIIERAARLSSGKLVTDVVAKKKVFTRSWQYLAHTTANTTDGGAGRNELKDEVDKSPPMSLIVRDSDETYSTYEVKVTSYKENAVMANVGAWYYQVELTLEEL